MKKYWYKTYISECPPCGYSTSFKERQYTPKPKDYHKRYEIHQFMCNQCMMG